MLPTSQGAFRLFRAAGITVLLHWSWLLVAAIAIENRKGFYTSLTWNAAEYLALFVIVLLHEFGHSLACRQVGGRADQIVLWPLGGVAYVAPPPRPGAVLWSIAAGPLVNVALIPVLYYLVWSDAAPDLGSRDAHRLLYAVWYINLGLLIFNILPIYPLDGGQILRALLWFPLGPARSLLVATVIGFIGVAGLAWFAFQERSIWMGVLTLFIFMNCRQAWSEARAAMRRPQFRSL
jgi:Zn-dependent protease